MATAEISIAKATRLAQGGGVLPVVDGEQLDHDIITLSGASQQSDFAVPATGTDYLWIIQARGGDMRVLFGADPTVLVGEAGGWLVLDGQTLVRSARAGHKAAVITA